MAQVLPNPAPRTMLHLLTPTLLALAPAPDITGVYEVDGLPTDIRVVLHERAEGEIIGYIAGSPMTWIESGQRYGDGALLELMGSDGGSEEPWTAALRLRVNGRHLEGVFILEKEVVPLTLIRSLARFTDEPWVFYDILNEAFLEVQRTLDLGGNFIGGGFSASDSCSFMACGGNFDSWTEVAGNHDIWSSSTGDCGQTGHLTGTFDSATNQVDGTWDSTDCNSNTYNGIFLAGKRGSTYDKHIQAVLLSIGTFADDLEAESLDAADVFHSAYMSDGFTRSDWETQIAAWYASYDQIEVEISSPSEVVTIIGSDVHPYLLSEPRISWRVSASGLDVVSGSVETFWEREEPDLFGPGLRFIGVEDGRVVFTGNGETQPLSIGFPVDLDDLSTTENPAWPFGVHGGGHAEDGHPGIDFTFTDGAAEITAVEAGTITDIRDNETFPNQVDVIQEIRAGVRVQYGHIYDPASVSIGDVLLKDDVIGNPGNTSLPREDPHWVLHFALSFDGTDDVCPVPWFNTTAALDWETIWPLCQFSEELCEPLECNDRDASPPYTATWDLETAGTSSGPDSIYFYRADGYAHDYDYTFFDSSGIAYESGSTSWASSPSTIGLHFTANGTATITYAAADIINDELTLKLNTTSMPTNMTGAATYRYQL